MAEPPSPPEPPSGEEPIASRLLETGVGVTQRVARVTGVDQALNTASEEVIVGAFESPAFERALIRLAEDGRLLDILERAVGTADVEDAVTMALDSQAADRIWAEILASDKAQMLVERIADAPEVRAAIAQQGLGLVGDIGLQLRRLTRPLDRVLERIARGLVRRPRRTESTKFAGLVTRSVAGAVDLLLLLGSLALVSAVVAALKTAIFGEGDGLSATAVLIATISAWALAGTLFVTFWGLAGQTPGMAFIGIRLDADGERRIGFRRAVRRLFGLLVALLPFGIGYLAMLIQDERRGWQDLIADTTVVYEDRKAAPYARGQP
jgi:uncharacterized RDD family membrane protein YckC